MHYITDPLILCIEIQKGFWFCFMLGLLAYILKTGFFYFFKTNFGSVVFMRLKTCQNRAFLNTGLQNLDMGNSVKISNYLITPIFYHHYGPYHLLLAFIDQQPSLYEYVFCILFKSKTNMWLWITILFWNYHMWFCSCSCCFPYLWCISCFCSCPFHWSCCRCLLFLLLLLEHSRELKVKITKWW